MVILGAFPSNTHEQKKFLFLINIWSDSDVYVLFFESILCFVFCGEHLQHDRINTADIRAQTISIFRIYIFGLVRDVKFIIFRVCHKLYVYNALKLIHFTELYTCAELQWKCCAYSVRTANWKKLSRFIHHHNHPSWITCFWRITLLTIRNC